jgi:hypothetical protein
MPPRDAQIHPNIHRRRAPKWHPSSPAKGLFLNPEETLQRLHARILGGRILTQLQNQRLTLNNPNLNRSS